MRSIRAQNNIIAVSANTRETAINTPVDPDTAMQTAISALFNIEPRRENDAEELSGREEASRIYDMGTMASGTLPFEKAQPQHVAFLAAYALGQVSTAAAGSTGYKHTITPIQGDLDVKRSNPSFTTVMRFGNDLLKRRFSSCFVDSFTLTFSRDDWVKANGSIKATGKYTDNVETEIVAALDNVTELTLDTNGVYGTTAAERLDSVHSVLVDLDDDGVYETPVTVNAADDSEPAVLTIESAGGAGTETVNYKILYRPLETATWMTMPAKVVESNLRVSETVLTFGGIWNGTTFSGGRNLTCEAKSVEWSFNNNSQIEYCFGEAGNYAGRQFRDGRTQTLKLDREFRETVLQRHIADNDTFGLRILSEGAEYESGHKYTVEVIFPKLGIINAPLSIDGKRIGESADISVLEDDTYGSVIVNVKNMVSTYAA